MHNLINKVLIGMIPNDYHRILYEGVLVVDAKVIIDLGTFHGSSADVFSRAAEKTGGKVYTIDIRGEDDDVRGDFYIKEAKELLKERSNVEFIQGDSIAVGVTWDKGDVDIVFCDSDHAYKRVLGELMAWEKYNPKVFFIHDTYEPGGAYGHPYFAMKAYASKKGKQFFNFDDNGRGLGLIIMREDK